MVKRICLATLFFLLVVSVPVFAAESAMAAPDSLEITPHGGTTTAGQPFTITVTAYISPGNVNIGYLGTVHFESSDGLAALPVDYTFTAGDNGVHNFEVTLFTVGTGTQTISVTDLILSDTRSWTVIASPATGFKVTAAPSTMTAGTPKELTVTAIDAYGNTDTSYAPIFGATLTFSGPGDAPDGTHYATVNWVRMDVAVPGIWFSNGVSTPSSVTLRAYKAETTTINVSGDGKSSAGYGLVLTVYPDNADSLDLTPNSGTAASGGDLPVTVTAYDTYENIATGYTGTVQFASSDSAATLPVDYPFTGADNGTHTFTTGLVLRTPGTGWTVTVTDESNGALTDISTFEVISAATILDLTPDGGGAVPGTPFNVTVTAYISAGNVDTGYLGTVHFASSDGSATLPVDYTFTAGDNGVHTFIGVTLVTLGNQTVTVSDTVIASLTDTGTWSVAQAAATSIAVTPSTGSTMAGTPFNVTVTVYDAGSQVATGYRGTVRFTSSDMGSGVSLPADYTFKAGDKGVQTFAVTLSTSGSQTVTVTDTGNPTLTGASTWSVAAVAPHHITLLPAQGIIPFGSKQSYLVQVFDLYGNFVADVTSASTFSIDSAAGGSWDRYVYTSEKAGVWTVTATYGSLSPATAQLTVIDAAIHHIVISPDTSTIVAGTTQIYTAQAYDVYSKLIIEVTSAVTFSIASGAGGSWGGTYKNAYTAEKAGKWTVTGTYSTFSDTASLTVNPEATIDHLNVTSSTYTQQIGVTFAVTVSARDRFGNLLDDDSALVVMSSNTAGLVFDANGDGTFGDATKTLSDGIVAVNARCDTAATGVVIKATAGTIQGQSAAYKISTTPISTPPVAVTDSYTMKQGDKLEVKAPGLLENDNATDSVAVIAVLVSSVNHGTLTFNDDGSFSYKPEADFSGADSFAYKLTDGTSESNIVTVTITVEESKEVQGSGLSTWIWYAVGLGALLLGGVLFLYYGRGAIWPGASDSGTGDTDWDRDWDRYDDRRPGRGRRGYHRPPDKPDWR